MWQRLCALLILAAFCPFTEAALSDSYSDSKEDGDYSGLMYCSEFKPESLRVYKGFTDRKPKAAISAPLPVKKSFKDINMPFDETVEPLSDHSSDSDSVQQPSQAEHEESITTPFRGSFYVAQAANLNRQIIAETASGSSTPQKALQFDTDPSDIEFLSELCLDRSMDSKDLILQRYGLAENFVNFLQGESGLSCLKHDIDRLFNSDVPDILREALCTSSNPVLIGLLLLWVPSDCKLNRNRLLAALSSNEKLQNFRALSMLKYLASIREHKASKASAVELKDFIEQYAEPSAFCNNIWAKLLSFDSLDTAFTKRMVDQMIVPFSNYFIKVDDHSYIQLPGSSTSRFARPRARLSALLYGTRLLSASEAAQSGFPTSGNVRRLCVSNWLEHAFFNVQIDFYKIRHDGQDYKLLYIDGLWLLRKAEKEIMVISEALSSNLIDSCATEFVVQHPQFGGEALRQFELSIMDR